MRAVRLLGARCVITGIQPAVAQIIVGLGLELQGVVTLRSLREGLRFCLRRLGFRVTREEQALGLDAGAE
jgi:rsbT co-antagonist protein RsbR